MFLSQASLSLGIHSCEHFVQPFERPGPKESFSIFGLLISVIVLKLLFNNKIITILLFQSFKVISLERKGIICIWYFNHLTK